MSNPLVGPSSLRDLISPQFHQNNFPAEIFIKSDLGIKLDKDDQICRLALTQAGCPLGPLHCPLRHTLPSVQNFQPQKQQTTHPRERTVCKHWLRGLCKKGDACEFLHEYNLRRMPECWWFAKYGYCSAGDECLYAHPKERRVECPDYNRGFCKLGPTCPRKHVRRVACQLYLTGFCPLGPECPRGHPKPGLPPAEAYEAPSVPSIEGPPPPGFGRFEFDRSFQGGNFSGPNGPIRRNLDEVLCFKCGEKGHYANHCRNRNVSGPAFHQQLLVMSIAGSWKSGRYGEETV
ncbi:mRNA 3'-end-processing protein YTH1 [Favolaschia claudopus]|uniref:mRNA 3'-end-processing protein n=1 Tax=Favolaschia claudopus TaxID=2862362 RepID=A0AAW0EHE5_9AGAR